MRFEPSHIHQQTPREPNPHAIPQTHQSPTRPRLGTRQNPRPAHPQPHRRNTLLVVRQTHVPRPETQLGPKSLACRPFTSAWSIRSTQQPRRQTLTRNLQSTTRRRHQRPPAPRQQTHPAPLHLVTTTSSAQTATHPLDNLRRVGAPRPLASRLLACLSLVLFSSIFNVQGVEYVAC